MADDELMPTSASPAPRSVGPASGVVKWLPGVRAARTYEKAWLPKDLAAGLVLTALLVPAGMGYAQAAGLPAINGLYATIVPLLAYALFGPSRLLVLGPDSSLAPLIAATILPLAATGSSEAAAFGAMLALLSGALCVAAGLFRFGFLAELLSKPVRYGYLNGIALTVLVGQLPKLFGFSTDVDGLLPEMKAFAQGVVDGETNRWALAVGAGSLATIVVLRRLAPRVPGTLVAVVGGIVAASVLDFADKGVSLVGQLPQGLPSFDWPGVSGGDLGALMAGAVGIAFVSFADTSVLSRTYAIRTNTDVDPDQELVALGMANVASGLFQGFSISSSSSRTPAAESAGARTQLTGVVGAAAILVLLVAFPGLFRNLPSAVLAAVVIAASATLVEIPGVVRLLTVRRSEFALSMVAFAGVALLGVVPGIGIAVGLSLLNFMRRAWRPNAAELVRVDGVKGYHDSARHPEGRQIPGLLLYRFDAPLFFANGDYFEQDILRRVDRATEPVQWVVVTAEPITDVDATAADALEDLVAELRLRGITLAFAELKGNVRDRLARSGLVDKIGPDRFYRTIGQAVKAYLASNDVPWTDWEDRPAEGEAPAPPSP